MAIILFTTIIFYRSSALFQSTNKPQIETPNYLYIIADDFGYI